MCSDDLKAQPVPGKSVEQLTINDTEQVVVKKLTNFKHLCAQFIQNIDSINPMNFFDYF